MADQPHFRVHRSELLPALDAVFEGVDSRGTIPILGNILLQPVGGELMLRGTDLAIEIGTTCQLLDEGTQTPITVAGAALRDIIKNFPESAEITFSPGGFEDQVRIQAGRSRFSVLTLPVRDFPSIADKVSGEAVELEIGPLIDALMKVLYAVKEDKARVYLSGVCLQPSTDDRVAIVGCDGHNLAVVRIDTDRALTFPPIIAPIKFAKAVKKLFGEAKGRADLTISSAMVRITLNGVTIISKLVDGTYPDYSRLVPTGNQKLAVLPVASFRAAVSRVCLVAENLEKDTVRLQFEPGVLKVSMTTQAGEEATDDIAVDYQGEPVEIGFNGKYLTSMLSSISTQDVELRLHDATMPGLFRPTIDCDEHYVLMPRRL